MTRDWKTGESIEDSYYCWKDPILEDEFGITEADWNKVIQQTVAHVRNWADQSIAARVSGIVDLLLPPLETLWQGKKDGELLFRWLPCRSLQGATVADHSLTASAISYCLGYDDGLHTEEETLDYLRLSALTATWKADRLGEIYDTLWTGLSPIEPKTDGNSLERIVYLAKTVASERTRIDTVDQFSTHPLKADKSVQKRQVGLVLGGATKIKGYFLESARLPEIRGASALLDRINLEDVPALFGRKIRHDPQRSVRVQKDFSERTGHVLLAPECVIYAAGGKTLAFTPTSVVHKIADEIERIYTKETLVANSVAVGDTFDLLELQYGLNPTDFWIEDFRTACSDAETSEFMENYYGSTDDKDFLNRKCFGELTTKLAGAQFHRREGNPSFEGDRTTQRDLPTHVETAPYQQRCESCERRPAIIYLPRARCEACTRKHVVGRITKKESDSPADQRSIEYYLDKLSGWQPASRDEEGGWCLEDWSSLFKRYLQVTGKAERYIQGKNQDLKEIQGPQRLNTIADASAPPGFITFIYADGNNMGGYLENVETPAQYRQFSERVFVALQKSVFDALAVHLSPTESGVHPFEIISIGGDDLLLIVPGSKAFEVVHAIGENFDREFDSYSKFTEREKDKWGESQRYTPTEWVDQQHRQPAFSLSLGFVIADEHTPIGFLEHLANSLLGSAKTRAKTLKKPEVGYVGGTVDFLVLKSFSMITSELADFRKKFYKTDTENSLTMRPFTLHELRGLIQTVQAFKNGKFPRSQLYQLQQSLRVGRQTSTLDYFYFRSRLRDGKGKLIQRELERNWQGAPDIADGQGPWYAMPQKQGAEEIQYETLLFDIIEAYEFIPEPDGQPDDQSEEGQ